MGLKRSSGNEANLRCVALAATVALTAGWSANAFSRTQPETDCSGGTDLKELTAPVEAMVLKPVDHVPLDQVAADLDTAAGDTSTPLLRLAPRVSDTLRVIFDEDGEPLIGTDRSFETPTSPIAESEEIPDLSELPDDGVAEGIPADPSDLPLLERQMYRIDI